MVWGGNEFVGGAANPKKVPQLEKKTADRPPHDLYREKRREKAPTW